jgi:hypothetical protein
MNLQAVLTNDVVTPPITHATQARSWDRDQLWQGKVFFPLWVCFDIERHQANLKISPSHVCE